MEPLEYESAKPAGAVKCEVTENGLRIVVQASSPDPATIRRLARRDIIFAGSVTALLMVPMGCIIPVLTASPHYWLLSKILVGLLVLFFALGVYCSIWQSRSKRHLRVLVTTMRQSAEVVIDGDQWTIRSEGPYGAINRPIHRSEISDVGIIRDYFGDCTDAASWPGVLRWLLIRMIDGSSIQLLPERSESEYGIIVGALREMLAANAAKPVRS